MLRERLLEGRVAIVTGGGKGIGAATAVALARAGAAVTVAARTAAEINVVAQRIRQAGGEALAVSTDITDAKQIQAMVNSTIDAFDRIDFLINCAAVVEPFGQPAWEVDPSAWREPIDVNLTGVFLLCHSVLPHMLQQGSGRLLIVSSSLGELVVPRASAYCAARAGVNHFTRVLAAELLGSGVTANIVYPGIVETEGLQRFRSGLFGGKSTPLAGRVRTRDPFESAHLLLWLCSPPTAWMTGQIVSIDDPMVQRRMARFLLHNAMGSENRLWSQF
jgi:3-oxoacyl-[acyl-carrier protein] reductase